MDIDKKLVELEENQKKNLSAYQNLQQQIQTMQQELQTFGNEIVSTSGAIKVLKELKELPEEPKS